MAYQRPLITDEERRAYGDEALSVMERKAREVVQPVMQQLNQQNQQLRQELQKVKSNDIFARLNHELPGWKAINRDPDFWQFLRTRNPLSPHSLQQLLEDAFASGDVERVLSFFHGYLRSKGRLQDARRSSTAPRRGQAAQVIPRRAISEYFNTIARNPDAYTPEQKQAIEREFIASANAGLVQ